MAGKYYAVRKGTVTGIFRTWEECKKNVHGYSGAEYKSFKTLEEAEAYMKGGAAAEEVTDTVPIYVDERVFLWHGCSLEGRRADLL